MNKVTEVQYNFLQAYYKACETSQPSDWHYAAMLGKQMFNEISEGNAGMAIADSQLYKQSIGAYK